MLSLPALILGFCLDSLLGDPLTRLHPVVLMGKLISLLEKVLRRIFPKTTRGEQLAGAVLWLVTVSVSGAVPWLLLSFCRQVSPWLSFALESFLVWQILAVRSLKAEAMKVYDAIREGLPQGRAAVARIVGRDTERLDEPGVIRATVETVAENTSDGILAPLLFLAVGGVPAGMVYKAVNTMDSMLGYVEPPYKNIGLVPAKMDDFANLVPARVSALLMLQAGRLLGLDAAAGWRIFRRDRYHHASPNSAQTESVAAGLLGLRLAGDAWYHGVLHKKPYIGDPTREIAPKDIPAMCTLMELTAVLGLAVACLIRLLIY